MNEINFRNCTIELTPFERKLQVYVSDTLTVAEIVKNSQLKDYPFSDEQKDFENDRCVEMFVQADTKNDPSARGLNLIIIGKYESGERLLNSIVHESMHVVHNLFDTHQITLTDNTDELYAYTMGWLVEKIWNEVGK